MLKKRLWPNFLWLLLVVSLCRPSILWSADVFWQPLTWTTSDGIHMAGLYHPASRPEALTWVLLHGLGSNKEEWDAFGRKLAAKGNGVFIYDARGHHESSKAADGHDVSYKTFTQADWAKMPDDLAGAVEMLKSRYGISERKIAVGGASLGANVALVYASRHPESPALVLLSSGAEYAGINIVDLWSRWDRRPVFAAASPEDTYAYQTLRFLAQQRPDANLRVAEGPGAAHGVNMFADPLFTKKLLDWMASWK